MYIFQKVEKVDNHTEALLDKMEYEMNRIHNAADILASQAMIVEDVDVRACMHREWMRLKQEAREIDYAYYRLKAVMAALH